MTNCFGNNSKFPWGILDILVVLGFIFVLTNFFTWLTAGLIEALVIIQKYLISTVIQTSVVLLALIYFRIIKGVTWRQLGISLGKPLKTLKNGIIGGIVLFALVVVVGIIMESILPMKPDLQPFAQLVMEAKDRRDLISLFVIGSILAPIGEEVYFRGLVYPVFKNKWGVGFGMILSGIFFALLHFDIIRFFPLALGGIGLAYIYEKTGSLFACMIAHGLWNGIMIILLYLTGLSL
ncbi:MAG: type II CAAX endopeptidase family protein [Bacillota bacterium]